MTEVDCFLGLDNEAQGPLTRPVWFLPDVLAWHHCRWQDHNQPGLCMAEVCLLSLTGAMRLQSETVATDAPVRYLSVQGHWFEVLEQTFGGFIICFASQHRAVNLRLQGAGGGLWCAPRGPWSFFHKVYVFCRSLPRTGVNSVCMVKMTALDWRTFALHLPSFSLVIMPSGGHSKNKEERGWLGRLRHCRALHAGKSCPVTQDKTLKPKSVLTCPALPEAAKQGNVPWRISS